MGFWMNNMQGKNKIIINKSVMKVLRKLPKDLLIRISRAIDGLSNDPRPVGCKKLKAYDNLYRIRVGDCRISYAIEDDRLIVLIIEAAPCGGAYRSF
jgi:mRNA interferase RelE/StbE